MTEAEFDQLTGEVLATPRGKEWMAELQRRSGTAPITFAVSDWKARIARMRERWRCGSLTPD